MTSVNITFRTEPEQREALDALAKSFDRDRSWIINEAIKGYLDVQQWNHEQIQKGLQSLERGQTISHEEMKTRVAHLTRKKIKTTR